MVSPHVDGRMDGCAVGRARSADATTENIGGSAAATGRFRSTYPPLTIVARSASSGIIAIFDEVWVAQVEKALAKAEKIDKEKIDKESVEKAKEAASKAS